MTSNAISHPGTPLQEPDWFKIGLLSDQAAATALKSILSALDAVEEEIEGWRDRLFNRRACAFRIYRTRQLWKLDIDPKSDRPFTSMDAWIEAMFPGGTQRYAKESAETEAALPDVPIKILAETPRCNARLLASKCVSDSCRKDPEIHKAMIGNSDKGFRQILNATHGQMLEEFETLKFRFPKSTAEMVRQRLAEIGETWNLTTPESELLKGLFEDDDDLVDPDEAWKEHQEVSA